MVVLVEDVVGSTESIGGAFMADLTAGGLARFASSLDASGQHDLADRMDALVRLAQFSPDDIFESKRLMSGFDPESDAWRAPLQTRLHWQEPARWQRDRTPKLLRPYQLRKDPDWVSPGERPWFVGEGIEKGNYPEEFEIVPPGWHPMDPASPSSMHQIQDEEIWERLKDEIRDETGIEADSLPELFSKLVHIQYMNLRYGQDEYTMEAWEATRGEGPEEYDQELMQKAIADVDRWVSEKFTSIDERLQEDYEPPERDRS